MEDLNKKDFLVFLEKKRTLEEVQELLKKQKTFEEMRQEVRNFLAWQDELKNYKDLPALNIRSEKYMEVIKSISKDKELMDECCNNYVNEKLKKKQ